MTASTKTSGLSVSVVVLCALASTAAAEDIRVDCGRPAGGGGMRSQRPKSPSRKRAG
jgi:hypothetical protein